MKKTLLLGAMLLGGLYAHAQIVNIPDPVFKERLLNYIYVIDTNSDGEIQVSEAEDFDLGLIFWGPSAANPGNITDLTGVEAFVNITELQIRYNQVEELDLSSNTKLWYVDVGQNNLTSLNLNNCSLLTTLFCDSNELTSLDISDSPLLTDFLCTYNHITALDVSQNPLIETLLCGDNELISLDVSGNLILKALECARNNLPSIDVSANIALKNINCEDNLLETLDLTANINLQYLYCGINNLTAINLSNNTALVSVGCYDNQFTTIDFSGAPNLLSLNCGSNPLTFLDLSENTALLGLTVYQTPLTSLNLSANSNLISVSCQTNYDLEYINLKNGNNSNISLVSSEFGWLPALADVCLDQVNSPLANLILSEVLHPVNFSETCIEIVGLPEVQAQDIALYPNPVTDVLTIYGTAVHDVSVYNMCGQEVLYVISNIVNFSGLQTGVYMVRITDIEGNIIQKKVVKQ